MQIAFCWKTKALLYLNGKEIVVIGRIQYLDWIWNKHLTIKICKENSKANNENRSSLNYIFLIETIFFKQIYFEIYQIE